jgi:hypothetical protein
MSTHNCTRACLEGDGCRRDASSGLDDDVADELRAWREMGAYLGITHPGAFARGARAASGVLARANALVSMGAKEIWFSRSEMHALRMEVETETPGPGEWAVVPDTEPDSVRARPGYSGTFRGVPLFTENRP